MGLWVIRALQSSMRRVCDINLFYIYILVLLRTSKVIDSLERFPSNEQPEYATVCDIP